MKGSKGIVIFVTVVAALLFLTHCEDLNSVPGVHVQSGGVSIDVGDFHYNN